MELNVIYTANLSQADTYALTKEKESVLLVGVK